MSMAGKPEDDGKKRVAGDKEIKGVFVCVFADVSSGASPGPSTLFSSIAAEADWPQHCEPTSY